MNYNIKIISIGIMLGVGYFTFMAFLEHTTINETWDCYKTSCSKTTLDEFNKCIDLGFESTGFLSSEHYWLCDGIKVTKTCTEKKNITVTNGTILDFGIKCKTKEKEKKQ